MKTLNNERVKQFDGNVLINKDNLQLKTKKAIQYVDKEEENHQTLKIDQNAVNNQLDRLKKFKEKRSFQIVEKALYNLDLSIKKYVVEKYIQVLKTICFLL